MDAEQGRQRAGGAELAGPDVSTCSSRRSGGICPVDGGFGIALQPAAANKRAAAIAGPVRLLNFIAP